MVSQLIHFLNFFHIWEKPLYLPKNERSMAHYVSGIASKNKEFNMKLQTLLYNPWDQGLHCTTKHIYIYIYYIYYIYILYRYILYIYIMYKDTLIIERWCWKQCIEHCTSVIFIIHLNQWNISKETFNNHSVYEGYVKYHIYNAKTLS